MYIGSFLGVRFPPLLCEAASGPPRYPSVSTTLADTLCPSITLTNTLPADEEEMKRALAASCVGQIWDISIFSTEVLSNVSAPHIYAFPKAEKGERSGSKECFSSSEKWSAHYTGQNYRWRSVKLLQKPGWQSVRLSWLVESCVGYGFVQMKLLYHESTLTA